MSSNEGIAATAAVTQHNYDVQSSLCMSKVTINHATNYYSTEKKLMVTF